MKNERRTYLTADKKKKKKKTSIIHVCTDKYHMYKIIENTQRQESCGGVKRSTVSWASLLSEKI